MSTHDLLVGTTNTAKGTELAQMLAPYGFRVLTLRDLPEAPEVVEDGETFADNARKKASAYAKHFGMWTLADDSGIEVDALGGAPGIYSARYAGTDEENNARLLEELAGKPPEQRTANYYCHVAAADPTGKIRCESTGVCRGRIRTEPAGTNGFGYDPLFEIRELHKTFGELGPAVKQALSHRSRAMRAIVRQIVGTMKSER